VILKSQTTGISVLLNQQPSYKVVSHTIFFGFNKLINARRSGLLFSYSGAYYISLLWIFQC